MTTRSKMDPLKAAILALPCLALLYGTFPFCQLLKSRLLDFSLELDKEEAVFTKSHMQFWHSRSLSGDPSDRLGRYTGAVSISKTITQQAASHIEQQHQETIKSARHSGKSEGRDGKP